MNGIGCPLSQGVGAGHHVVERVTAIGKRAYPDVHHIAINICPRQRHQNTGEAHCFPGVLLPVAIGVFKHKARDHAWFDFAEIIFSFVVFGNHNQRGQTVFCRIALAHGAVEGRVLYHGPSTGLVLAVQISGRLGGLG